MRSRSDEWEEIGFKIFAAIGAVCGAVVMIAVTIALVAHLLNGGLAKGAPVPPPPRELTPDMLVGRWALDWERRPGTLWLHADGTYAEQLSDSAGVVYHGEWAIEGNVLTQREWRYDPGCQTSSGPVVYRITLERKGYPAELVGSANGYTRIRLSEPKR